ncbi:MAG: L,D-transpeptidase [Thermoleophilia bacterium]
MLRASAIGPAMLGIVVGCALAGAPAARAADPAAIAPPTREHGATTARLIVATRARARLDHPGRGGRRLRPSTDWSGQDQVLLVLDSAVRNDRQWLKVLIAARPTGSTGWIPRDHVQLSFTRYWIDVRIRTRRVVVYRGGRRIRTYRAVVGRAATPTPHGLAAVYERNRQPDPDAFLGPWALSLTATSAVLENFGGGPGRVAIHGRSGASLRDPLGSARSHGCIRIDNGPIRFLARTIPVGTPVKLTR